MKPNVYLAGSRWLLTVALTWPLLAQAQATTLWEACQKAQIVVRATVLGASDPSPDWHRLSFRTTEVLAGSLGAQFVLWEPAGACCGRSLFAMAPGEQYLFFLQRQGPALHSFGGSRGILAEDAALTTHVRGLLQATTPAATTELLVQSLTAELPRIAEDAALALASLPQLQLSSGQRTRIAGSLQTAVGHGHAIAPSLADILVRDGSSEAIDTLLPLFLQTPATVQARMLQRALGRCLSNTLMQRLPLHLDDQPERCLRALELLEELDPAEAIPTIEGLLRRSRDARVQYQATCSLLARDVSPLRLRQSAPQAMIELAQRNRQRSQSPRFRLLENRR